MIEAPKTSDLLIAPPQMPDLRFRKTVLMLTHENAPTGPIALCLNKPTPHTLQEVIKDLDIDLNVNFPMYWGGPVAPGTIWMLHSMDWQINGTMSVGDGWGLTSSLEMFHCLADADTPRHFRLFFGFCSWAHGQLQAELKGSPPWSKQNSWLIAKNPGVEWLFDQPDELLWEHATEQSARQAVNSWI